MSENQGDALRLNFGLFIECKNRVLISHTCRTMSEDATEGYGLL